MTYTNSKLVIPVCLFAAIVWVTGSAGGSPEKPGEPGDLEILTPNLTDACYRCLCHVSTECDLTLGCTGGKCGPFSISRVYWIDAGKIVAEEDDPEVNQRISAWEDCARSYTCAKRIIGGYLQKFVKDCNGDGVIDCYDYMMINGNGGYGCTAPLNRSADGRLWLKRFETCNLN